MRLLARVTLAVATFLAAGAAQGGTLERRAVFGAALTATIPDDTRKAQDVPAGAGVLIVNVLPGLSAEAAGIAAGDIVLSLGGQPVSAVADIQGAVRARHIGDTLDVSFVRAAQRKSAAMKLRGFPFETVSDFDIVYDQVDLPGASRRTITTRPRDGKRHPAVVLIGGIGCYSVDAGMKAQDAYRDLLYSFTRRGFVTLRVEKSGMGDSTGEPCANVDLNTEVEGLVAGLRQLKQQPYVDPSRVFIFGHSIGGVTGPLVATQEPVRGLLVMETVGLTWFEYELINARRQLKLEGVSPAEVGAAMLAKELCMHRLLIAREPRDAILKERPDCAGHMSYPASDAYVQQVASQNLAGLWAALKGTDVGVIYGASDYVTGVEESRAVVEAVNAARPGKGEYIEIPDMDHFLNQVKSQQESAKAVQSGAVLPSHPRLAKIAGDWLSRKAASPG